jgi:Domain of unknown function (DUF397)
MLKFTGTAIRWRKSSISASQGDCVEVAVIKNAVLVRDSKNPTGPVISVSLEEWADLLQGLCTPAQRSIQEHAVGASRVKTIK